MMDVKDSLNSIDNLVAWAEERRKRKEEAQEARRRQRQNEEQELAEALFEEMVVWLEEMGQALGPWCAETRVLTNKALRVEVRLPDAETFYIKYYGGEHWSTNKHATFSSGSRQNEVTIREKNQQESLELGLFIARRRAVQAWLMKETRERQAHEAKVAAFRKYWQRWERVCEKVRARNARMVGEIQASVDAPFRLWELEYGVTHEHLGELDYDTGCMSVLAPGPDLAGYWTQVLSTGQVRRVKVFMPATLREVGEVLPSEHQKYVVRVATPGGPVYMAPGASPEEVMEVKALAEEVCWDLPARPRAEDWGLEERDVWEITGSG